MLVLLPLVVVLTSRCAISEDLVIGGIFNSDADDMKLSLAVSASNFNFKASVKEVAQKGNILEINKHLCELAEEGVIGVIDGVGGRASEHIQAVCDLLELPHVVVQNNDLYSGNWSLLNVHPSPAAYNLLLKSLIIHKEWKSFTILYVKGYNLMRVTDLLQMGNDTDEYMVSVRELSGDDYRDVLTEAKQNGYTNFVVDCPSFYLEQLLRHAQQVGLMADEHSYIIVSPDLFSLDLNRYRYGGVNMTGFRLVNFDHKIKLINFTTDFNNAAEEEMKVNKLRPEEMKIKVLLVHDAVEVFFQATKKVKGISPSKLDCKKYEPWSYGSSLLNFMKTNKVEGLTRYLKFDGLGNRIEVNFDILELTAAGSQNVGSWEEDKLNINRPLDPDAKILEESVLKNKTLKVLIAEAPPYGYVKESYEKLEGNDRYEGFTVDLIEKISEILGFNYEFVVEKNYGAFIDGKWTGMIAELREGRADLAICDFTITAERQSAIDFSTPFMSLGIGILYKKPSKQPPEMFSFMAVFSKEVWYYMMLIQMALGLTMIFVGRISHKEWQNPVPCIEQPEELTNQFSFANSVWLIIGSVMQQGSEIAPIALAPRMITSVWWFFTMVMVASYVGTLVAFLTVEKNVLPFETVEDLAKLKSIKYGVKERGSTLNFFAQAPPNSIYRKMHAVMEQNKQYGMVPSNDDGVNMAENSTYAFFMESTSIEYYTERHCDLIRVGGLLDSKSYGIGMQKNSPYKKYIDDALLKLKEKGAIDELKTIWWKEKRGGGNCQEQGDEEQKQLGMKNMSGAFVVLGVGCLIGLFISILDMLWGVFKRSIKYSTTFRYELIEELKFVLKFSGNVKPVKRTPKIIDGSFEILAKSEGKDDTRSLRSLGSGKSTDTHRTHRSHNSRHSSRSISVALARRREYL